MHGMGAISDEDKLDAEEAKKVLRRTAAWPAVPKTIFGALASRRCRPSASCSVR
jgi:hypothetical protein